MQRFSFFILPFVFFTVLLLVKSSEGPKTLVFDEIHYVPASKSLITFKDNINWVHPPLAKEILGLGWFILTKTLNIVREPTVFRWISIVFGMWLLGGVYAWLLKLNFSQQSAQIAVWLTGFNGLWFVQSKTAMLDVFQVAFSIWGLLFIYSGLIWRGWILLGLSLACKWSASPFYIVAIFLGYLTNHKQQYLIFNKQLFNKQRWLSITVNIALGIVLSLFVYVLMFLPLSFLEHGAVSFYNLISYHQQMIQGFSSIENAYHPYSSQWWQWPTLWRPMWYFFENNPTTASEHSIWAGGNPVLYWTAMPALLFILWKALFQKKDKNKKVIQVLALLYWAPLLFWAILPRHLQLYYYYLPSSLWVGPILVWTYENWFSLVYIKNIKKQKWLLIGFTLLCCITFLYFLPIMDARALPSGRYRIYMWFQNWI